MVHVWAHMGSAQDNPMGVNVWVMSMGLFVLSFGYWCTDFLVIQRAMVAKNIFSAQKTPLFAAIPKMFLPFVVILPGLIAYALGSAENGFTLPLKEDMTVNYDMTIPTLLVHFFPSGLLGVGLTALMASFMSGMAGNVTAFNSVFTFDIYQALINKKATDKQCLFVGKVTTVFGIIASIFVAYIARSFNNIMDLLQLIFGFINAPLFATFLLGMFYKRTTAAGAFYGLLIGTFCAWLTHATTLAESKGGYLLAKPFFVFHSTMTQALVIATIAWSSCFFCTLLISFFTQAKSDEELKGLVYSLTQWPHDLNEKWYFRPAPFGCAVLFVLFLLNYLWY
jgi:SSS family solute:Na+ symporter